MSDNVRAIIGKNIKKCLKIKGLRQSDLANALNVSEAAVSFWIKGTNSIDIDKLAELCQYLGVSLNQIFGIEEIDGIPLSEEDKILLTAYHNADPTYKKAALDILIANPAIKSNQLA